jgi:hypothetical protein
MMAIDNISMKQYSSSMLTVPEGVVAMFGMSSEVRGCRLLHSPHNVRQADEQNVTSRKGLQEAAS